MVARSASIDHRVSVIVAAKDAAATIGRAIASALAEQEVSQVIAIDDGSSDRTSDAAALADDGSGRLVIERFDRNRGPSAARNRALELAKAPLVAILDADDVILKGRFATLLARDDWDIIADDIVFVPDRYPIDREHIFAAAGPVETLGLTDFINRSVLRGTRARAQLGFLKPIIRRNAKTEPHLRYDETVRLGEDFLLYATLLAHGARFLISHSLGYLAVERPTSLSARHGVSDLAALLAAETKLAETLPLTASEREAMRRRITETRGKWAHRTFLDHKRTHGLGAALHGVGSLPSDWVAVCGGIAGDKWRDFKRVIARSQPESAEPRFLLR